MEVSLRPLEPDNFMECRGLEISEQQRRDSLLHDMHTILKDAVNEEALIKLVVYDDAENIVVGFAQVRGFPAHFTYDIGKFLIGERFQRKGYGMAALKKVINELFVRPDCNKITVTYPFFNEGVELFYAKAGFVVVEDDEGFIHTELVRQGISVS